MILVGDNWISCVIRREVMNRVKAILETDTAKREGLTNSTMFIDMAIREKMRNYFLQVMSHINTHDDHVKILDQRLGTKGRIVAVYFFRYGAPYCDYCEEPDCLHVQFAWEIPHARLALESHGQKPPPSRLQDSSDKLC